MASAQAVARRRGRVPDLLVFPLSGTTWGQLEASAHAAGRGLSPSGGTPGRVVWQLAIPAEDLPAGTGAAGQAAPLGAPDAALAGGRLAAVGSVLSRAGGPDSIFSLSTTTQAPPQQARGAFRQAVQAVRHAAPGAVIEWQAPSGTDATQVKGYPGDDVVDLVAVFITDSGRPWTDVVDGPDGLNAWLDFATAHGKRLVIRWAPGARSDAAWIQDVHNWVQHAGNRVAYEAFDGRQASVSATVAYDRLL